MLQGRQMDDSKSALVNWVTVTMLGIHGRRGKVKSEDNLLLEAVLSVASVVLRTRKRSDKPVLILLLRIRIRICTPLRASDREAHCSGILTQIYAVS
jgi:hypothetical protein